MTELEQYIQSFFGVTSTSDLKTIVSFFELTFIKKGAFLLKSSKRCDKLCFVQSGFLRMYAATNDREVTQWIASKGSFSTDLSSFIFETPARWTIQALVDTELYTITKEDYKKIGQLITQWNDLEKLFLVQAITIMEDRIFRHLSMTAEERYLYHFDNNSELFNQVPLQYIASMLGMTPETFSRIRKKQLS